MVTILPAARLCVNGVDAAISAPIVRARPCAAAGGAMSGNAGYAGGLMTGSENNIGMRDIPPKSTDTDDDA